MAKKPTWTNLLRTDLKLRRNGVTRRRRTRRKGRVVRKGGPSKTRRGRLDYITHRGDADYNRRSRRQKRSAKGVKKRPYSRR